ncbi:hypothetical protein [Pedobacter caeni]|uniref:DUF3829 domain-containing protein n=1 Tax=Pedobacter caeni TaxID=288992 RepID=A0A1M5C1S9_9SPHI|nr:hypothetical protein [Pedobacter caeni]SHF48651.1 hypothetical protein SAMN04488522_1021456 [Pedobacter caeni]
MSYVKQIFFSLVVLLAFFSCKDKRHDKSKEYLLDAYAFNLVADVTFREQRLAAFMRKAIQEKKKIMINPNRVDTVFGNKKYIDDYDKGILNDGLDSILLVGKKKPVEHLDNLTREESRYLQEKTTDLANVFHQIQTTYKAFDNYYRSNSFNLDKGKKGFALIDSIQRLDMRFTAISDSIILKSDVIYRDIYLIPKNTRPSAKCASAMKQAIKTSNKFNALLDSLTSGTKPYNKATQKDIAKLMESIEKAAYADPTTTLFPLAQSKLFWEYHLYARFRDLQSTMTIYTYSFRHNRPTKEDLDYLKDIEQRMKHCYALYIKL